MKSMEPDSIDIEKLTACQVARKTRGIKNQSSLTPSIVHRFYPIDCWLKGQSAGRCIGKQPLPT